MWGFSADKNSLLKVTKKAQQFVIFPPDVNAFSICLLLVLFYFLQFTPSASDSKVNKKLDLNTISV